VPNWWRKYHAVLVSRSLDGNAVGGSVIDHAAIMKGGTLRFEMASKTNLVGGGFAG
jgi:putative alpha-1,2-mannosidase